MNEPYKRNQGNSFAFQNSRMASDFYNRTVGNQAVRHGMVNSSQNASSNTFNRASSAIGNILKSVGYDVKSNSSMPSTGTQSASESEMNSFLSLNAPSIIEGPSSSSRIPFAPTIGSGPIPIPPPMPPIMPMSQPPPMVLPPPMSYAPPSMYPPPPIFPKSGMQTNSLLPTPPAASADTLSSRGKKRSLVDDLSPRNSSREKSLSPLSKRMMKESSRSRYRDDFYSPDRYDRRRDYSPEFRRSSRDRSRSSHHSSRRFTPEKDWESMKNLKMVNHQLAEQVACDKALISELRSRIYTLEENEKEKAEGKETKERDDVEYVYKESALYWCGTCPDVSTTLLRALNHLTVSSHIVSIKNKSCPWKKAPQKNEVKKRINAGHAEGYEFMRHVPSAFHCDLCLCFLGDMEEAERHIKSYSHNREFYRFKLRHPDYVSNFKEKMRACLYDKTKSEEEKDIQEEIVIGDDEDGKDSGKVNSPGENIDGKPDGNVKSTTQDNDKSLEKESSSENNASKEAGATDESSSSVLNVVLEPQPVVPLGLPRKMVKGKTKSQNGNNQGDDNDDASISTPDNDIEIIEDLELEVVDECR